MNQRRHAGVALQAVVKLPGTGRGLLRFVLEAGQLFLLVLALLFAFVHLHGAVCTPTTPEADHYSIDAIPFVTQSSRQPTSSCGLQHLHLH